MERTSPPGHEPALANQALFDVSGPAVTDSIIESIPGAFYMLDSMGRYVRWNAYQRDVILGLSDEEMAGRNAMATFHPDDRSEAIERMRRVLETGQEDIAEGRVLLCGGPDYRWFLMTGRRIIIAGMPYIIGTGVDITDRKHAEEENESLGQQLQHSQKMELVGKLAGGIAHDFNNMLAVILGHAEALLEETSPEEDGRSHLDSILKAASRSADLTRQLLAFARRQVVLPKVLELDTAVEGTLSILQRLIGEHVALRWHPGSAGTRIKIDPSQIDQILTNLCVNARDSIEQTGTVIISTASVHLDRRVPAEESPDHLPGHYAVISVDFRGSTGYGQAFTDAIQRDWGGKPLEDLQKGFEAALKLDSQIDGTRACARGASYGGYMVNWIAGQWADRFDCLVQHDGIFDTRSFYYATEELWFPRWDFGGSYTQAREIYEKWNPANHVDKWKTPMLVVTGELDYRVPYTQGLQSFTALQERGIPSQLLVFPDENHWVLGAKNSLQWHETVFAWLDRWLKKDGE
jgi:PAS domain S-box-containing protein